MANTSLVCKNFIQKYAKDKTDAIKYFLQQSHKPQFESDLDISIWSFAISIIFDRYINGSRYIADSINENLSNKSIENKSLIISKLQEAKIMSSYGSSWNNDQTIIQTLTKLGMTSQKNYTLPMHEMPLLSENAHITDSKSLHMFVADEWNFGNIESQLSEKHSVLIFPSMSVFMNSLSNNKFINNIENSKFAILQTNFQYNIDIQPSDKVCLTNSSYQTNNNTYEDVSIDVLEQYYRKVMYIYPQQNEMTFWIKEHENSIRSESIYCPYYSLPSTKATTCNINNKRNVHILPGHFSDKLFEIAVDLSIHMQQNHTENAILITNARNNRPNQIYFSQQQSHSTSCLEKIFSQHGVNYAYLNNEYTIEETAQKCTDIICSSEAGHIFFYGLDPVNVMVAKSIKSKKSLISHQKCHSNDFDHIIYTIPISGQINSKFIFHPSLTLQNRYMNIMTQEQSIPDSFNVCCHIRNLYTKEGKLKLQYISESIRNMHDINCIVVHEHQDNIPESDNIVYVKTPHFYNALSKCNAYIELSDSTNVRPMFTAMYLGLPIIGITHGTNDLVLNNTIDDCMTIRSTNELSNLIKKLKNKDMFYFQQTNRSIMKFEYCNWADGFYVELYKFILSPSFF